ncbi:hypothetical protein BpHYR1_020467 [Brachionus plicatilis]|uniref:Uncharacterized protein n=1 Tax=Brachionus plicatilis TaxID=10195 RepID=A0A3M7Q2M1_BRAPC|nr:hypothetical protein BpHYR1_020467 [Brachionus plicatilis]
MKNKNHYLILLCLALFYIETNANSKHLLSTCDHCSEAISNCLSCSGEKNCKKCIKSLYPKCNQCSRDIFSGNDLEIEGEKYLSCHQLDSLHEDICKIRCRGEFFQFGQCAKLEEASVCQCFESTPTTTTQAITTTTKKPFVQRDITYRVFTQETTYINDFKVLANGDLVAAGYSGYIKILDSLNGTVTKSIYAHSGPVWSIDILPNGYIVSGGDDKKIKIWDLNANLMKIQLNGHSGLVRVVKSLPNGHIASGSTDNTIKIWNSTDGSLIYTLLGHSNHVQDLVVLNSGDLASGSKDKTIKIWDIETGLLKHELNGNFKEIWRLGLLKNGNLLVLEMDKIFRSIDPYTGEIKINYLGHPWMPRDFAVLPSGDIATGDSGKVMIFWDADTGYIKKLFNNPSSYDSYDILRSLVVTKSGDLVGAFENKKLKIWNTGEGPF